MIGSELLSIAAELNSLSASSQVIANPSNKSIKKLELSVMIDNGRKAKHFKGFEVAIYEELYCNP